MKIMKRKRMIRKKKKMMMMMIRGKSSRLKRKIWIMKL